MHIYKENDKRNRRVHKHCLDTHIHCPSQYIGLGMTLRFHTYQKEHSQLVIIERVKNHWDMSRSIKDIHSIRDTENNQCNEEYKKNKSSITLSIIPSLNNSPFDDLLAEHRYSTSRIHNHYLQSTTATS